MRTTLARRAPAVLVGLALASCVPIEAAYGVPDTGEPPMTTSSGTTTSGTDSDTATGSGSGSSTGVVDTGTSTSADGSSGSSTDGDTDGSGTGSSGTVGEPEYGLPETTSG